MRRSYLHLAVVCLKWESLVEWLSLLFILKQTHIEENLLIQVLNTDLRIILTKMCNRLILCTIHHYVLVVFLHFSNYGKGICSEMLVVAVIGKADLLKRWGCGETISLLIAPFLIMIHFDWKSNNHYLSTLIYLPSGNWSSSFFLNSLASSTNF